MNIRVAFSSENKFPRKLGGKVEIPHYGVEQGFDVEEKKCCKRRIMFFFFKFGLNEEMFSPKAAKNVALILGVNSRLTCPNMI